MSALAGRQVLGRAASVWALGLLALLLVAAPASGAKVKTLGQPASHVGPSHGCTDCSEMQIATAKTSPSYIVPRGHWTITSWRAHGLHDDTGHARLRIYRPTDVDGKYQLLDQSDVESFPKRVITEHKTHLNVRKGDHLGLSSVGDFANIYRTSNDKDVTAGPTCPGYNPGAFIGTGTACPIFSATNGRLNLSVKMKRR